MIFRKMMPKRRERAKVEKEKVEREVKERTEKIRVEEKEEKEEREWQLRSKRTKIQTLPITSKKPNRRPQSLRMPLRL